VVVEVSEKNETVPYLLSWPRRLSLGSLPVASWLVLQVEPIPGALCCWKSPHLEALFLAVA